MSTANVRAVAIPSELLQELGWPRRAYLFVERRDDGVFIHPYSEEKLKRLQEAL